MFTFKAATLYDCPLDTERAFDQSAKHKACSLGQTKSIRQNIKFEAIFDVIMKPYIHVQHDSIVSEFLMFVNNEDCHRLNQFRDLEQREHCQCRINFENVSDTLTERMQIRHKYGSIIDLSNIDL